MLLIWLALLIPVLLLNPSALPMVLTPAALIMAIGIETLIREWYGLFPRNPYARIAALLPLTILLASVVITNIERYYYGNHYTIDKTSAFHAELPAVRTTLDQNIVNKSSNLIVPEQQTAFYDILRREYGQLKVSSHVGDSSTKANLIVIASSPEQPIGLVPHRITTNDLTENSVLLRVYNR
jgi:hypothetical protein